MACGLCVDACPQVGGNEFDVGLKARKAIYRPFPQSVPATYVIDPEACLNFTSFLTEKQREQARRRSSGLKQQEATRRPRPTSWSAATAPTSCDVDAIDFDMLPEDVELRRGLRARRRGLPGVRRPQARQLRLRALPQRGHQPRAGAHAQRLGGHPGPRGPALGPEDAPAHRLHPVRRRPRRGRPALLQPLLLHERGQGLDAAPAARSRGRGHDHPLHRPAGLRQGLRRLRAALARGAERPVRPRPPGQDRAASPRTTPSRSSSRTRSSTSSGASRPTWWCCRWPRPPTTRRRRAGRDPRHRDRPLRLHRPPRPRDLGGGDHPRGRLRLRQRRRAPGDPRLRRPGLGGGGPGPALPHRRERIERTEAPVEPMDLSGRRGSASWSATAASTSPACSTSRTWPATPGHCPDVVAADDPPVRLLHHGPGRAGAS